MINLKIISIALPCLGREDYCKVVQNQNIISEIKTILWTEKRLCGFVSTPRRFCWLSNKIICQYQWRLLPRSFQRASWSYNFYSCKIHFLIILVILHYMPEKIWWTSPNSLIIYSSAFHMIGIKAIWKSLYMTVKFLHEYLQPTFYAEHAVALSWFSFAAPKYLLG